MSYYNSSIPRCYNTPHVEYFQPACHYCEIENYQHPNVVENFDLFGWWPWMRRSKCSCPSKDKKWYDMGSLLKSRCPKDCRYNQCESCPTGHIKQTIHLKKK